MAKPAFGRSRLATAGAASVVDGGLRFANPPYALIGRLAHYRNHRGGD
jgi:hypothetical protein